MEILDAEPAGTADGAGHKRLEVGAAGSPRPAAPLRSGT